MTPEQEDLILDSLHIADIIAKQIGKRTPAWIDHDDLVCAARLGLADAARRYDPKRKVTFATFASPRIRGAVLDWLREQDHLSRSHRAAIRRQGGDAPVMMSHAWWSFEHWDIHPLATREWHPRDRQAEYAEETVGQLLRELPGKWRRVMEWIYFDGLDMVKVGRRLGRTPSAVCQTHKKALRWMRERAGAMGYQVPEGVAV